MTIAENHGVDLNVATTPYKATTAEKLIEAAKWDEIPSHPLTREQFGFNKVDSIERKQTPWSISRTLHPSKPAKERDRSGLAKEE